MINPPDQNLLVDICNLFNLDLMDITEVTATEQGMVIKGKRGLHLRVPFKGKNLPPEYNNNGYWYQHTYPSDRFTWGQGVTLGDGS
jgi:hypothetical protein